MDFFRIPVVPHKSVHVVVARQESQLAAQPAVRRRLSTELLVTGARRAPVPLAPFRVLAPAHKVQRLKLEIVTD